MVTWMKKTHRSRNSRDQYSSSYRCKGQNKAEFTNDKIFAIAGLVHYPQKQSGWDIPLSTTGAHFYASVALLWSFWNLAINIDPVFFCTGSSNKLSSLPPAFSTSTAHLSNQPSDVSEQKENLLQPQSVPGDPVQPFTLLSGTTGNSQL